MNIFRKEVDRLLDLDDRDIIKNKFLDMRSQIDDLYVELGERARRIVELEKEIEIRNAEIASLEDKEYEQSQRISKLESELAVKENANEALKCIVEEQRKTNSRLISEKDEIMKENTALKVDVVRTKRGLEPQNETTQLLFEKWFSEDAKEEPLPFSCDECEEKIAKINLEDEYLKLKESAENFSDGIMDIVIKDSELPQTVKVCGFC